jgi:hypothetical protein
MVTIVENIAIANVQSTCFFEPLPIVKIAVRALKPIFRIWLQRSVSRLIDCAVESLAYSRCDTANMTLSFSRPRW